jgi:hypothetical protein
LGRKFLKRLGPEKHFISVAHHTLPAEIANAIDNFYGTRTGVCEIPSVENQVGRGLLQIRPDCLKRRLISMDIGQDCDTHQGIVDPGAPSEEKLSLFGVGRQPLLGITEGLPVIREQSPQRLYLWVVVVSCD